MLIPKVSFSPVFAESNSNITEPFLDSLIRWLELWRTRIIQGYRDTGITIWKLINAQHFVIPLYDDLSCMLCCFVRPRVWLFVLRLPPLYSRPPQLCSKVKYSILAKLNKGGFIALCRSRRCTVLHCYTSPTNALFCQSKWGGFIRESIFRQMLGIHWFKTNFLASIQVNSCHKNSCKIGLICSNVPLYHMFLFLKSILFITALNLGCTKPKINLEVNYLKISNKIISSF